MTKHKSPDQIPNEGPAIHGSPQEHYDKIEDELSSIRRERRRDASRRAGRSSSPGVLKGFHEASPGARRAMVGAFVGTVILGLSAHPILNRLNNVGSPHVAHETMKRHTGTDGTIANETGVAEYDSTYPVIENSGK